MCHYSEFGTKPSAPGLASEPRLPPCVCALEATPGHGCTPQDVDVVWGNHLGIHPELAVVASWGDYLGIYPFGAS